MDVSSLKTEMRHVGQWSMAVPPSVAQAPPPVVMSCADTAAVRRDLDTAMKEIERCGDRTRRAQPW
jgi:hypothetical protein